MILTKQGADWMASYLTGGSQKPNCIYVIYTNSSSYNPGLDEDTTQATFESLASSSTNWFCRAYNKVASYTKASSSTYTSNIAEFSTIIKSTDVASGGQAAYGTSSKLCAVALVYAPNETTRTSDKIIAVSNFTTPVSVLSNVDPVINLSLQFGEDDESDSSSSSI